MDYPELIGVVRTAIAQAELIITADGDIGGIAQAKRDLPLTLQTVEGALSRAQRAAPVIVPSKELFIAWAISHGELDLTEASEFTADGEIPKCKNGWVPAKFYYPETEIAWRAWANSKAVPVSDAKPVASEEQLFEDAREHDVFGSTQPICPTWYATELRKEGWMARAAAQPVEVQRAPSFCQFGEGPFKVWKKDESDLHGAWFVVMPGGPMLEFNHHADDAVDEARARWVCRTLNNAAPRTPLTPERKNAMRVEYATAQPEDAARAHYSFIAGIEWAEREHGIKPAGEKGGV